MTPSHGQPASVATQPHPEDDHLTPLICSVHDIPAVDAHVDASSSDLQKKPGTMVFMDPVKVILRRPLACQLLRGLSPGLASEFEC